MHRVSVYLFLPLLLLSLAGCRVHVELIIKPDGFSASYTGELDYFASKATPKEPNVKSLGRGTGTIDKSGETFTGEWYDTNNDGLPDRLRPDAGQTSGLAADPTNGRDWYSFTPDSSNGG